MSSSNGLRFSARKKLGKARTVRFKGFAKRRAQKQLNRPNYCVILMKELIRAHFTSSPGFQYMFLEFCRRLNNRRVFYELVAELQR